MRIKTGDLVKVIAGKVKGLTAKVVSVDVAAQRVILENGPKNLRHLKPEKSKKFPEGGIIERPASMHLSNVMLMSEEEGRPYRAGVLVKDDQKVRVSRGRAATGKQI